MKQVHWWMAATIAAGITASPAHAVAPASASGAPPTDNRSALSVTTAAGDPAIAQLDTYIAGLKLDKSGSGWKTNLPKFPTLKFDAGTNYFVNIETNKGAIKIRFLPDVAPNHVSNFMYLARLGFFDDIVFHRVITGFMAQGGDPLGAGTGGPGYRFGSEFDLAKAKHDRPFLLSMANAGEGTDGSQFFLTFVPTPWLDGKHTIFGEVVAGQDAVKALEKSGSQSGRTTEKLFMSKVTIEAKKK